jgi:hypothetical protein
MKISVGGVAAASGAPRNLGQVQNESSCKTIKNDFHKMNFTTHSIWHIS